MSTNIYHLSLRNKRWFTKRDKIIERDNHKCTVCGSSNNLCVHHTFYWSNKFAKAWEYPDNSLITVCSKCHEEYHLNCETPKKEFVKKKIVKKKIKKKPQKSKRQKMIDKLLPEALKAEKKIREKYKVSGI